MASQASFFQSLPARLTPSELEVQRVILELAAKAVLLLPDHVPLQTWVERRMPQQVSLGTDAQGKIFLEPMSRSKSTGKGGGRLNENAPTIGIGPGKGSQRAETFLASLPPDSLTPEESDLRFYILGKLENRINPMPVEELARDVQISKITQSFLPSSLPVEEWIERRIGQEVIEAVKNNKHCFKLAGLSTEEREAIQQEYFATLPIDRLTPDEQRLRDAFYDYFAAPHCSMFLSFAGKNAAIKQAKLFLPKDVTMKAWVENRIGGEIVFETDVSKQFRMVLTEAGHMELESRQPGQGKGASEKGRNLVNEKRSTPGDAMGKGKAQKGTQLNAIKSMGNVPGTFDSNVDERAEGKRTRGEEITAMREEWLSTLPDDTFTDAETALADTLMEFLTGKGVVTLTSLGMNAKVQAAKQFIPKSASLQYWISNRMGADVEIARAEGCGEGFVGLRPIDTAALHKAAGRIRSNNETSLQNQGASLGPTAHERLKAFAHSQGRKRPVPSSSTGSDSKRQRFGAW